MSEELKNENEAEVEATEKKCKTTLFVILSLLSIYVVNNFVLPINI